MKVVAGGAVAPDDVVGRDQLIASLWRILERQSVVLTAERRIGKTTVITKMKAQAPEGTLAIYRDLEGVKTPQEFAESIFRDVDQYLSGLKRIGARMTKAMSSIKEVQAGQIKVSAANSEPHWKALLTATLADLAEHQEKRVVLFWDEIPFMLYKIQRTGSPDDAMDILDSLRQLRNHHPSLRMVFTGSIGLQNVITALKKVGYANDPTNDMKLVDVPPLTLDDAQTLARKLFEGENIGSSDLAATTRAIAEQCDGFPYYVQNVVDSIALNGEVADVALVERLLRHALTDPQDAWHMAHYQARLDTYYPIAEDKRLALALLDQLAASDDALSFEDFFNHLKSILVTEDREAARNMLTLLQRDHYIVLKEDGSYRFRFSLIQRYWRQQRGSTGPAS